MSKFYSRTIKSESPEDAGGTSVYFSPPVDWKVLPSSETTALSISLWLSPSSCALLERTQERPRRCAHLELHASPWNSPTRVAQSPRVCAGSSHASLPPGVGHILSGHTPGPRGSLGQLLAGDRRERSMQSVLGTLSVPHPTWFSSLITHTHPGLYSPTQPKADYTPRTSPPPCLSNHHENGCVWATNC